MKTFIHIDSLYLNVRYPKSDIYELWAGQVEGIDKRILGRGVAVGDCVVRTGGRNAGYSLSVWKGDIRAFLTPHTDEIRGVGCGMGIWVQLGPQFLLEHGWNLHAGVLEFLDDIGIEGTYKIHLTRIDLAIDILGLDIDTLNIDDLRYNWVGRSTLRYAHFDEKTQVSGYQIGSKSSAIFIRMYNKLLEAEKKGTVNYWQEVWGESQEKVTRIEWQVDPREGDFEICLIDFYQLNKDVVKRLALYLLDWGRLVKPNDTDSVKSRWKDTDLWVLLRQGVEDWNPVKLEKIARIRKPKKEVSDKYLRQLAGNFSGGMAKINPTNPSFHALFSRMELVVPLDEIIEDAKAKGKVIQNLRQKSNTGEEQ